MVEGEKVRLLRQRVRELPEVPWHERPEAAYAALDAAVLALTEMEARLVAIETAVGGLSTDNGPRRAKGLAEV